MTPNEYKRAWRDGVKAAAGERMIDPRLLIEDHWPAIQQIVRESLGAGNAPAAFDRVRARTLDVIDANY